MSLVAVLRSEWSVLLTCPFKLGHSKVGIPVFVSTVRSFSSPFMSVVLHTTAGPGQGRAKRARQGCLEAASLSYDSRAQRRRKGCSDSRIRSVSHILTRCVAARSEERRV